jgi:hypothetical protein
MPLWFKELIMNKKVVRSLVPSSLLLLLLLGPGLLPRAAGTDAPAGPSYRVEEIWRIERGDDPPYSLFDPELNSIPPALMGVMLDDEDNLYLSDAITEKLLKIRPDGSEAFAVGSVGEGPEDHLGQGEPLRWPGCGIARSDYSRQAKVICYDEEGHFQGAIPLEGFDLYLRLWGLPDGGLGVALKMYGSPAGGMKVRIYLTRLDPDGALLDSLMIKQASYPPMGTSRELTEADFEINPRVAIAEDGRLYVQRDMYRWVIECFDSHLRPLWVCSRDVSPRTRTEGELAAIETTSGLPPSPHEHVIRRIVPRAGGEVWVETLPTERAADGAVLLDRIGREGESLPPVALAGLPEAEGDYEISGDRLLWKLDDDAPPDAGKSPYLAVYRIVPTKASR